MSAAPVILIVDDEPVTRAALEGLLGGHGYEMYFAANGLEGLERAAQVQPDLILLDVMMPRLNGYDVCRRLRADATLGEVPILLVTSLDDRPSRLEGLRAGADDFITKPFDALELQTRVQAVLRLNRYRRLVRERREVERLNSELVLAYDQTIAGWSAALDLRDKETEGHSRRVTEMTVCLGRAAGLSAEALAHIRRGALLHDVGKLAIPDAILLKPGPLTEAEWVIMRRHPVYAHEWLSPIAYLRPALDIPYCHHERWDGSGYPRGLSGAAIPLSARLFALADVWDALSSRRPYREAWPEAEIRAYVQAQAGAHFDPDVVDLMRTTDCLGGAAAGG